METEQQPTDDERAGMNWWYTLSENERAAWLAEARSDRPADAWEAFKRLGTLGANPRT